MQVDHAVPTLLQGPATPATMRPTPPTRNPHLLIFLDRSAQDRIPPDVLSRIPTLDSAAERAAVIAILRDRDEDEAVRNEASNLLRQAGAPEHDDLLAALLADPDERERFRSFAAQHMGTNFELSAPPASSTSARHERLRAQLRTLLDDRHVAVRREALLILAHHGDAKAQHLLERPLADPAWSGMQDLVLRCLAAQRAHHRVSEMRLFAYDADQVVRCAAIAALGELGDVASRPAFEEAARSQVARIQRAGVLALERIAHAVGSASRAASATPAVAP